MSSRPFRVALMPCKRDTPGNLADEEQTPFHSVVNLLDEFMILPSRASTVIAAWVVAAWLIMSFEKFPHLGAVSPEKRCGKTRLLELLNLFCPRPLYASSISPAALYRVVAAECPTLLLDEAQAISNERRKTESGQALSELYCGGIERNAKVVRCEGPAAKIKVVRLSIYSPKAFALIGSLDGVLADRCIVINMRRKTTDDVVNPCRSREIIPRGAAIASALEQWATDNQEAVEEAYSNVEPFDISNDRMAELYMPLQAVLSICSPLGLATLEDFAREVDRREDAPSIGIVLLNACREILADHEESFILTDDLIDGLKERQEEPWATWGKLREGIDALGLSRLLRQYGIQPGPNKTRKRRGYLVADFEEPFRRYLKPAPVQGVR